MNLTALTLLQGRLFDMALESDTQLQRLRRVSDAECLACDEEPEWYDTTQRSALVEFLERRLSMAMRALNRIEDGLFGHCERCGRQIDPVHLFVQPDRSNCDACDPARVGNTACGAR